MDLPTARQQLAERDLDLGTIRARLKDGSLSSASDAEQWEMLSALVDMPIRNESMRHSAVILGLTINHLQTARLIAALEKRSKFAQLLMIALAGATLAATVIGIFVASAISRSPTLLSGSEDTQPQAPIHQNDVEPADSEQRR